MPRMTNLAKLRELAVRMRSASSKGYLAGIERGVEIVRDAQQASLSQHVLSGNALSTSAVVGGTGSIEVTQPGYMRFPRGYKFGRRIPGAVLKQVAGAVIGEVAAELGVGWTAPANPFDPADDSAARSKRAAKAAQRKARRAAQKEQRA